jgi:hypothetical protein
MTSTNKKAIGMLSNPATPARISEMSVNILSAIQLRDSGV